MDIKRLQRPLSSLADGVLNSYSQVFFSDNRVFAAIILIITFQVPLAGLAGLAGVLISLVLAKWLGFDKKLISKGLLSYNTLLVTLPLGLYFSSGPALVLMVIFASILTFFLAVTLHGWLARYELPFLSWPFIISLWIVMLAARRFSALEVGDQTLFEWNRLYGMGGINLVNSVEWLNQLAIPQAIKTYFISMGAVFFQYSLVAGVLVAIGLLISSRIAFLLSLIGFFSAYLFYHVIGIDINSLDYTYIGFNYILMSIAIGGFFLIPSAYTFFWAVLLVPVVTFLTVGMEELLSMFHLSVYALPFNVVVLLFLFTIRQRKNRATGLHPVVVQHNNPERNLYAWSNYQNRLSQKTSLLFRLPVMGKWFISQGHDGRYTHQSDWRHAWDFVKIGQDNKTWQNNGHKLDDYHTWAKPVYPAAGGIVDSVTDGIPDNPPGDANTLNNWGNTVVMWHAAGLYTKYSHLKSGSIRFKPGDYVSPDQELAQIGNSGRSPEPHLHFQFQATPFIHSATLDYPFGYYLLDEPEKRTLRSYDRPLEGQIVSNLKIDRLLSKVFHLVPGQILRVSYHSREKAREVTWEVQTDAYNQSSIRDREGGATAWFTNDGQAFYFTHFEGSRSNPLYAFFTACFRIPLTFDPGLTIFDQIPLFISARRWMRWIQDWIAPFHIFLKTSYRMNYESQDDPLAPEMMTLKTQVSRQIADDRLDEIACTVEVCNDGEIRLIYPKESSRFEQITINTRN